MIVTVTGGTGHGPATLHYDNKLFAGVLAEALATSINNTYSTAIYYNPAHPPAVPSNGYLIVPTAKAGNTIKATGFGAIVVENNGVTSTVQGGGNASGQTVLAGNGGLTFSAKVGSVTVVAGGGDNLIRLGSDTSTSVIATSDGNDTIVAGGAGTIEAGLGSNSINLSKDAGGVVINSTGQDTVHLGTGHDSITALNNGSDLILGASSYSGSGYSLTFIGDSVASTILGGAGSYDIRGDRGGGVFHGGSAGDNSIVGGVGSVTIFGGGAGDTLKGGAGDDRIVAGLGNETLGGGAGANLFNLTVHEAVGKTGAGTTITVTDFSSQDFLKLGSLQADNYALNTAQVMGSNTLFKLDDGTTVVLHGFTNLTSSNFKG